MADCLERRVFTYDLGGDLKCSAVGREVAQAVRKVELTA